MAILGIFKKKKKKKSRKAYLIEQIDKIVSLMVRRRDDYTCRKCGRIAVNKGDVAHHHIFTKRRFTTRWLKRNGVTLCFHCHRWAHAAAEEFREWVLSWMPKEEYDALYAKSQMRGGYKENDLEWLLIEMKKEILDDENL